MTGTNAICKKINAGSQGNKQTVLRVRCSLTETRSANTEKCSIAMLLILVPSYYSQAFQTIITQLPNISILHAFLLPAPVFALWRLIWLFSTRSRSKYFPCSLGLSMWKTYWQDYRLIILSWWGFLWLVGWCFSLLHRCFLYLLCIFVQRCVKASLPTCKSELLSGMVFMCES